MFLNLDELHNGKTKHRYTKGQIVIVKPASQDDNVHPPFRATIVGLEEGLCASHGDPIYKVSYMCRRTGRTNKVPICENHMELVH